MIKEKTIHEMQNREFPDPQGDVLKVVSYKPRTGTLTVLVQTDGEPTLPVESPPIDPTSRTVAEIEGALADDSYDWNDAARRGLLEAEQAGDSRTTAIRAINESMEDDQ